VRAPAATIVIPVLNEGPRLRAAVDAVLRQRCEGGFEVVVVDGGSTDGCCALLAGLPGVRCIEAPGTGAGEARNIGASLARGRLLVFTDADCLPLPGWLSSLVEAMDAHPGWAGAGGGLRHKWSGRPGFLEDLDTLANYDGVITSNVAYRPEAFHTVGGFDPALRCAEDWDLAWRVRESGGVLGFVPEAVVIHAPSEDEAYPAFLRKQVWYARHDVPALLGHALGRRGAGTGAGRREARRFVATAALHAVGAAMVSSLLLAPAGALLLGAWAWGRASSAASKVPGARMAATSLMVHTTLKGMARGWGTWLGLADWLRRGMRVPAPTRAPEAWGPLGAAGLAAVLPEPVEAEREEPLQRLP
jgi:hypothetical protein